MPGGWWHHGSRARSIGVVGAVIHRAIVTTLLFRNEHGMDWARHQVGMFGIIALVVF